MRLKSVEQSAFVEAFEGEAELAEDEEAFVGGGCGLVLAYEAAVAVEDNESGPGFGA
jgi:hypothetical protein